MTMHPRDVRLAIMTADRSPQYIHTTLASLLLSDPNARRLKGLHVMVGTTAVDHLKEYAHHGYLQIHQASLADVQRSSAWAVHRRACLNYHRCLTEVPADCNGLCICEDDIIFADSFVDRLLEIAGNLADTHERYLISAYLPGNLRLNAQSEGTYGPYPPRMFFGTQCMYYSRAVVAEVAALIYAKGVLRYQEPYDMLVKEYAISINALYGPARSLVQHVGQRSTGLGIFHFTETFQCDSRGER